MPGAAKESTENGISAMCAEVSETGAMIANPARAAMRTKRAPRRNRHITTLPAMGGRSGASDPLSSTSAGGAASERALAATAASGFEAAMASSVPQASARRSGLSAPRSNADAGTRGAARVTARIAATVAENPAGESALCQPLWPAPLPAPGGEALAVGKRDPRRAAASVARSSMGPFAGAPRWRERRRIRRRSAREGAHRGRRSPLPCVVRRGPSRWLRRPVLDGAPVTRRGPAGPRGTLLRRRFASACRFPRPRRVLSPACAGRWTRRVPAPRRLRTQLPR
jgi:hypothetical protein